MSWRVLATAVAVASFALPGPAHAAGAWAWPLGSSASLAYGASYLGADGKRCTHGGIDIPAGSGSRVRACAPGVVTFAGLVPAGEGHRAYAVTVRVSDDLRVTYLPIEDVAVHKGETVDAGETLGSLASSGDASSGDTHLHLGVRRGDRQIDPMAMLCAANAAAPAAPGAAPPTPAGQASPHPSAAPPVSVPAPRVSPATASTPVRLGSSATAPAPSAMSASVSAAAGAAGAVAAGAAAGRSLSGPPVEALPRLWAPPEVRVDRVSADARALRDWAATWILRALLAAAAALCVRPVLKTLTGAAEAGTPALAKRQRA
jgi:hypothetical protein